ncbi:MAG: hypothetical protein HRU10_02575 [Opitutales bacterium]|nr:hypothetical protein [Opitutales bacterium]
MKDLWDELAKDNGFKGIQVSDTKGNVVASRLEAPNLQNQGDRLNTLVRKLEKSAESNLFVPDSVEIEFEKNQLIVTRANGFAVTLVISGSGSTQQKKLLERIIQEINTRPSSEWRKELESGKSSEASDAQKVETNEAVKSEVATDAINETNELEAEEALPDLEIDPSIEPRRASETVSDDDPLENLNIEPKQKAILKIQQKALVDARERAQKQLQLKQKEYSNLVEKAQKRSSEIQEEAALPRETLKEKRASLEALKQNREISGTELGKLNVKVSELESENTDAERRAKAVSEQEALKLNEAKKSLFETYEKQKSFTDSKVSSARRNSDKISADIDSLTEKKNQLTSSLAAAPDLAAKKKAECSHLHEAEIKQLADSLEAEVSEQLKATKDGFQHDLSTLTAVIEANEESLEQFSAKIDESTQALEQARQKAEATTSRIHGEINALQDSLKQEEISRLADLEEIDNAFVHEEAGLSEKRKSLQDLIAQKDLEEEEIRLEFEQRLKAVANERDAAKAEIDSLSEAQTEAADAAEAKRKQVLESSKGNIAQISENISSKELELESASSEITPIQTELDANKQKNAKLVEKQQLLATKREELENRLRSELSQIESAAQTRKKESLANANASFDKQIEAIECELASGLADLEKEVQETQSGLDEKKTEFESIRLEIGENLTAIKEAEHALKQKETELEETAAKVRETAKKEAQEKSDLINEQLDSLFKEIQNKDDEVKQLSSNQENLEADVHEIAQQNQKAQKRAHDELESLNKDLVNLKSGIEEAQNEVDLMNEAIQSSLAPYLSESASTAHKPAQAVKQREEPSEKSSLVEDEDKPGNLEKEPESVPVVDKDSKIENEPPPSPSIEVDSAPKQSEEPEPPTGYKKFGMPKLPEKTKPQKADEDIWGESEPSSKKEKSNSQKKKKKGSARLFGFGGNETKSKTKEKKKAEKPASDTEDDIWG